MKIDVDYEDIVKIFKRLPEDVNRLTSKILVNTTRRIIKTTRIIPKKNLGQHFLINAKVFKNIVNILSKFDKILEVGSGFGILTYYISHNAYVVGTEIDSRFFKILKYLKEIRQNLDIFLCDILTIKIPENYVVFSNLPFYITSEFIVKVVKDKVRRVFITIQKEVADRILSKPGSNDYGRISVLVSCFYDAKKIMFIDRRSFIPIPEVDACMIELCLKSSSNFCIDYKYVEKFEKFTSIIFSQRNKLINKVLREFFNIEIPNFESKRVYQLSPSEIASIFEKVLDRL